MKNRVHGIIKLLHRQIQTQASIFLEQPKHHPMGLLINQVFHQSVINKNLKVVIEGYVRTSDLLNKSTFGIPITKNDSNLYWFDININNKLKEINTWTFISDTIVLPKSVVNTENTISFFLWQVDGNGTTDTDDLCIKFIELETPSFLPEITLLSKTTNKGLQLFKNDFYSIFHNATLGSLSICSKEGDELLNNFTHYFEYRKKEGNSKSYQLVNQKFKLVSHNQESFSFFATNNLFDFILTINVSNNADIQFKTQTHFWQDNYIVRESFMANYTKEIKEVYTKNRKLDDVLIDYEYWLDKEGVKIGERNDAITFYHLPEISSLQINTSKNENRTWKTER